MSVEAFTGMESAERREMEQAEQEQEAAELETEVEELLEERLDRRQRWLAALTHQPHQRVY